jgi:hypothetical protein
MEAPADEDLGSMEAAACANPQGTNAMIAALAVQIGKELGRFKVGTDFKIIRGTYNQEHMVLSAAGLARCTNGCIFTKGLLTFQDARYDQQIVVGGEKLSAWSYAARLVAGYREQLTCEARPSNNTGNPANCPAEEHLLTHLASAPGGCDTNHTFSATTPSGGALVAPSLLKNKLLWAGKDNPYIGFQSTASTITIDPFYGGDEGDSASSGSCSTLCTKTSAVSLLGQCCSCNMVAGTYKSTGSPVQWACRP